MESDRWGLQWLQLLEDKQTGAERVLARMKKGLLALTGAERFEAENTSFTSFHSLWVVSRDERDLSFEMLLQMFSVKLKFLRRSAAASQVRLWDGRSGEKVNWRTVPRLILEPSLEKSCAPKRRFCNKISMIQGFFHHQSGCCMLRMFFSFHLLNYVVSKVSLPQHLP